MTFNSTFDVVARVRRIEEDGMISKESANDLDVLFKFNYKSASRFVYKFLPNTFKLGKYMILMKYDDMMEKLTHIIIMDQEKKEKYLLVNQTQFFSEILEGMRLTNVMDTMEVLLYGENEE